MIIPTPVECAQSKTAAKDPVAMALYHVTTVDADDHRLSELICAETPMDAATIAVGLWNPDCWGCADDQADITVYVETVPSTFSSTAGPIEWGPSFDYLLTDLLTRAVEPQPTA